LTLLRAKIFQRLSMGFHDFYHRSAPREGDWLGEYARNAQVSWSGTVAHVRNVRHFVYQTRSDYQPGYYDADYDLRDLTGVDLVVSRWAGDAIAHVFMSFGFRNGQHVAISVETRRRNGQQYSTFGGFFRNYALIYVVADERDLIGVRTDIRRERVSLYPLRVAPETARDLFRHYMQRVEALNGQPEFYHTVCNNCTTNVLYHAHAVDAAVRYNWKVLVSGFADRYAYDLGLLDSSLPFEAIQERYRIQRAPGLTPGADYSREIRSTIAQPAPFDPPPSP
jgi:hypothetical protein